MYEYSKEHGSWYLRKKDGELVLMTDNLAVLYDPETFTLHKHGDVELIEQESDKLFKKGFMMNILLLTKETPIDEVNKIIQISGYIEHFIKKYGRPTLPALSN